MDIDIKDFKDQKSLISNIGSLTTSQPRSTSITKLRARCGVRPSLARSTPETVNLMSNLMSVLVSILLPISLDAHGIHGRHSTGFTGFADRSSDANGHITV